MRILSLDLAGVTGWATWNGAVTAFGSVAFKGELGKVCHELHLWLIERASQLEAGKIVRPGEDDGLIFVYEKPMIGPKTHLFTAERLFGLIAITNMTAHQLGAEIWHANTMRVAKHFTGHGGGKRKERKERCLAACRARGFNPEDDNAAEALAILDFAAHQCGIRTDIPDGPLFNGKAA